MAGLNIIKREEATARTVFLLLLVVSSSLLVSSSFPPLDLGFLAWFGLSPLLFTLRQNRPLSGSFFGFLYGVLFGLGAFYWTNYISTVNLPSFIICLFLFALFFSVFGFFYSFINHWIGSWMIFGAPALWVAVEFARSNISFLSFPWNLLGHSQHHYLSIIQIADISGVYGISFLIVMVNQYLSEILEALKREGINLETLGTALRFRSLLLVACLTIFSLAYGGYKLSTPEMNEHLRIALVQANVLARNDMPVIEQVEHLRVYEQLTREAAREHPALVIWPASSLPAPITSRVVRFSLFQLARGIGTHILVGGAGFDKAPPQKEGFLPYSNSEFLISPSGRPIGQYNKIKLLAFNEYLPLQGLIHWPEWITTLKGSFIPGKEYTLFEVSGSRFGTPICWENLFPNFFRRFVKDGAQFVVSVTNEGFFGKSSIPYYQSLAIYVFRAVENRISIVRSATTGISCIIHPDGEIVERIQDGAGKDIAISGFLVRDVPLSNKRTFYTLCGDIFAYVTISLAILTILVCLFLSRRESR